jgi:hypothetical protein
MEFYSYSNLYITIIFIKFFEVEELNYIRMIIIIGTFKDLEQELSTSELAVGILSSIRII